MLSGTANGKVCCNAPCTEAKRIQGCPLPHSCPVGARSLYNYAQTPYNFLASAYLPTHYDRYEKPSTYFKPQDANEVTIDDLIQMMNKALDEDKDYIDYHG